jgi:hypothetical protein
MERTFRNLSLLPVCIGAALYSEVVVMNKNGNGPDKEPDWVNPANDRKTPYTEEEIDTFVEDFICGLDEQEWLSLTAEYGEEKASCLKMDNLPWYCQFADSSLHLT